MIKNIVLTKKISKKYNEKEFKFIKSIMNNKEKMCVTNSDLKQNILNLCKDIYNKNPILYESYKVVLSSSDNNTIFIFIHLYINDEIQTNMSKQKCIGIDIGAKNILTIVNNFGKKPLIIKGNKLNAYYNEDYEKFNNYINMILKFFKEYVEKENIDVIYIGKIYCAPYCYIYERIISLINVKVVCIDETNTSKASFIDLDFTNTDIISGKNEFSGERKTKSTYVTKSGIVLNADINAAYNILILGNPFAFNLQENKIEEAEIVNFSLPKDIDFPFSSST